MLLWLWEIYRLFECTLLIHYLSQSARTHVSCGGRYTCDVSRARQRVTCLLCPECPFLRYQINIFVDVIYSVWTSPHLSWASAVSDGCWCKLICNPTLGAVTGCWISRAGNTDSSYFYPLVKCPTVCQWIKVRINCSSIENIKKY